MKKILFLHGFFATGSCPMARALKEAFEGTAVVLTPDLPLHPKEALKEIRSIIDREQPDLLLGNSCGSFLAQMLAPVVGIPALLGNPYFMMTEFLKERRVLRKDDGSLVLRHRPCQAMGPGDSLHRATPPCSLDAQQNHPEGHRELQNHARAEGISADIEDEIIMTQDTSTYYVWIGVAHVIMAIKSELVVLPL